jgi:Protein of unknown function (DUF742)
VNAPGQLPEAGEEWDAEWLEFHAAWRPRLRAFLASVCGRDHELADEVLRESLLEHRRQWAAIDDPDLAHVELFAVALGNVRPASATPRRNEVVVLHDLVELTVGEIAAVLRCSEHAVRMHLALGHRAPDYGGGFALPGEEAPDVDHGVELLHGAYENLTAQAAVSPDDDPETDYALGLVCEQRGDLRGAALCFQRATAHNFEDAADRFVAVLAHLHLPSRGRHARHALIEPPPSPTDDDRLAIEALVLTSAEGVAAESMPAEQRAICDLCVESRAVAEVAARLSMPLDVARDLLRTLATDGMVVVHDTPGVEGPPVDLMERVLAGLRDS